MEIISFRYTQSDIEFDLFKMIGIIIFNQIEDAENENRVEEFHRYLGTTTFREFFESRYENLNVDPEIINDEYLDFLDSEISNIIRENFSKKYIGFYRDNLTKEIYNFNNLPISLEKVDKSLKENIGLPYDVSLYFERV